MTERLITAYLRDFRQAFEPRLVAWLEAEVQRVGTLHEHGRTLAEEYRIFTAAPGKRVRAALVELGYRAGGGRDPGKVVPASIAVELLHSFLLVHDDIIDRSDIRRNAPTTHRALERRFASWPKLPLSEREHLGTSLAIIAGDLGASLAVQALLTLKASDTVKTATIQKLLATLDATIVGEAVDVLAPFIVDVRESDVRTIHELKTARYTFDGPLQIGLIIAEADQDLRRGLAEYAQRVGIAFQIADDLLGVFGDETELGKSVVSDLEEGKETLLTVYTREKATPAQRERLASIMGRRNLAPDEVEEVRAMMAATGARRRTESVAAQLAKEAVESLAPLSLPDEVAALLVDLAGYVVARRS